ETIQHTGGRVVFMPGSCFQPSGFPDRIGVGGGERSTVHTAACLLIDYWLIGFFQDSLWEALDILELTL
ncbi:mCG1028026, partial [Mus musculus]